jgi:ABC-type nitrate/sulfonate/bicarbonate transport system substrate-binding protein
METKFAGLLAVATVFLSLAGTADAQEKQPRKIELNVFRLDAAMVAARARGFFAKEGIEVNATVTANSDEQMRGLGKGLYNAVTGAFDNVLAWSGKEGAEIIAVAQSRDDPDLSVFARPEIRNWSELKGKRLALDAVDTAYALVLRRILLAHGLDFNRRDYELVPVGATRIRVESLIRGEISATILNPPFDAQAKTAGMVRLGDYREVLPDYPGSNYAVDRAWAQRQKDDLVRFLRGWLAGIRWVKNPANREDAIALVAKDLKLAPNAAGGVIDEQSASGAPSITGLQSILDLRVQFGFKLPMGDSLDRYYDLSYFREAAGR